MPKVHIKQKSFKEVLDEYSSTMPVDTYFEILKAHDREMEEVRAAHRNILDKILATIKK